MNWFLAIIFATLLFSLVNILDKFLCSQKFKNNYAFAIATNFFAWIFLIWLVPFINFSNSFGWPLIIALISGLVYLAMWIFFWKALENSEVSRVTAIFNIRPIFTSFLSIIFLGELLSAGKWLAILLIVSGAMICSWEKINDHQEGFNKVYLLIVLSALAAAAGDILSKFALVKINPYAVYIWSAVVVIPLMFTFLANQKVRAELRLNLKDKQSLLALTLRGFISVAAVCFFYLALATGPASLVIPVGASAAILVFLFSVIISFFWPKFIKENITSQILFQKAIAIVLIVSGVVLINF